MRELEGFLSKHGLELSGERATARAERGRPVGRAATLGARAQTPAVCIEDAGLSPRASNPLRRSGLSTLADVAALPDPELQAIPNLRQKSLAEVRRVLREADVSPPSGSASPPSGSAGSSARRAGNQPRRPSNPKARRDSRIVDLREQGLTLEEIGERVGLTRERVRQIAGRAGGSAASAAEARNARLRAAAEAAADELIAAFRVGRKLGDVARELGIALPLARKVMRSRTAAADRAERRRSMLKRRRHDGTRYSVADLISAVRAVAERVGGVPSSKDYADLARGMGLPSLQTVANRLGWANGSAPRG